MNNNDAARGVPTVAKRAQSTYPDPLHARHRIIPAPLHAVHSYGFLRVSPRTPSSFLSRCVIFTGVDRRPDASQNAHGSPPVVEHAAHGLGSPLAPSASAVRPSAATVPATLTSCVVSYGSTPSSARAGARRCATRDARRARARPSLDDAAAFEATRASDDGAQRMTRRASSSAATLRADDGAWTTMSLVRASTMTNVARVGVARVAPRARATRRARAVDKATTTLRRCVVVLRARDDEDERAETKTERAVVAVDAAPSRSSLEAARARARVVSSTRGAGKATSTLDDYRERWDVPWGGGTVALGIVAWGVSFIGVAAIAFPLAMAQLGVDPAKMDANAQAEYLLAVQCAETVVSLSLVYALVSPHMDVVKDESKDWFKFDFSDPFERERGWAKYGLIGYGTTFLALAATGFVLDVAEKAQGGQQAIEKASEQVGTIDGVLPLISSDNNGTLLAVLTVTSVLAPLLEEVVFRGFILASLTKWLPTPGAVLFSSVLFGLAHFAPRDFVELVVLGMVLGFSYARTRNLLTPMLIHSMWNSGVLVVVAAAIKGGFAHELGIPGF